MAEPPGILCQVRNPVKINDGTMCAQKTPKPGITGDRGFWGSAWDDAAWLGGLAVDGAVGTYHGAVWLGREVVGGVEWSASELWSGTKWAASEVWSGAEWAGVEIASGVKWSLGEIRGGAVWLGNKVYDAYKYLRTLFLKILHAANWNILKDIAEPILGPTFMQAGVLWGIVESLGKDILSLLELGKMVVLAGCYELLIHPDIATTLALNPTTLPMVLTALAMKAVAHEIPELAAQMKKSDEQLKKMVSDLWKVVSNWNEFVGFVKALGKQLKQGTIDDFNKLKYYAQHRSLTGDFETGKIFGRALYQIIMLILIFVSGVGAVRSAFRFLAEVPALLRTAEIIRIGAPVEDLIEGEKIVQGTRTAEEIEEAEKISQAEKIKEPPKTPESNTPHDSIESEPSKTGETNSTKVGKQVHKARADARRASGDWDLVNSPITDKNGKVIEVPKRVDLDTGLPQEGTTMQSANPDAVNFDNGLIVDDKPAGRPIAKDRQEIIRFIKAYEAREGKLPETIRIERYDPATGAPAGVETYKPGDFLPQPTVDPVGVGADPPN